MRKERVITAALVFLFLPLWGCYESRFPLDKPGAGTIDPGLIGAWRCVQGEESENKPLLITVIPFDERQYLVEIAVEGEKTLRYRAYRTVVKNKAFLNVQEIEARIGPAVPMWVFARYTLLRQNILDVDIVRGGPFKGLDPSPSAVREVMESRLEDPELYQDFCVCTRIVENKN